MEEIVITKKLYGFNTNKLFQDALKIKEFKVVGETYKTYRIKGCIWELIRKSEMKVNSWLFFETLEQAKDGLIRFCKDMVSWNERKMEYCKKEIEVYKGIIDENEEKN